MMDHPIPSLLLYLSCPHVVCSDIVSYHLFVCVCMYVCCYLCDLLIYVLYCLCHDIVSDQHFDDALVWDDIIFFYPISSTISLSLLSLYAFLLLRLLVLRGEEG